MNLSDDDFTLLGLPIRLAQNPAQIDAQWRARQKQVHPDRQLGQEEAEQAMALQASARLNQARQRLKDPLQRALYLCQLRGYAVQNVALPPAFLMQQMQWNEDLEDAQSKQDAKVIEALLGQVQATQTTLWHQVETLLDEATQTQDEIQTVSRSIQASQCLGQLLFLHRLVQRIKATPSSLMTE
jgi:molecular chaperone HscB